MTKHETFQKQAELKHTIARQIEVMRNNSSIDDAYIVGHLQGMINMILNLVEDKEELDWIERILEAIYVPR